MARHDLTVLGGGIMGLSCAYEAAKRGLKVRLIETHSIGAGASGGLVGALAPHAPERWTPAKEFQLQALLTAEAHWSEVAAVAGLSPGYARTGRLQPIADDEALRAAHARAEEARTLWQGRALWQVIPASHAPFEPHSPTGQLIHDTLTARLSPRRACAALVAALKAKGATITIGDAPEEGAVIHATGHRGLSTLTEALGRKMGQGVKGQALSLHCPEVAQLPQIYAPGLHIVPHEDGTVAIGSTSENSYLHEETDTQADALLARARALVPLLHDAPEVARWSGIRPRAQSRQPLIGPWPGRPGHFIANGGFKIGFAISAPCAKLLIDAIEGQDRIPAPFRP